MAREPAATRRAELPITQSIADVLDGAGLIFAAFSAWNAGNFANVVLRRYPDRASPGAGFHQAEVPIAGMVSVWSQAGISGQNRRSQAWVSKLPKLRTRVRFPSPAPTRSRWSAAVRGAVGDGWAGAIGCHIAHPSHTPKRRGTPLSLRRPVPRGPIKLSLSRERVRHSSPVQCCGGSWRS